MRRGWRHRGSRRCRGRSDARPPSGPRPARTSGTTTGRIVQRNLDDVDAGARSGVSGHRGAERRVGRRVAVDQQPVVSRSGISVSVCDRTAYRRSRRPRARRDRYVDDVHALLAAVVAGGVTGCVGCPARGTSASPRRRKRPGVVKPGRDRRNAGMVVPPGVLRRRGRGVPRSGKTRRLQTMTSALIAPHRVRVACALGPVPRSRSGRRLGYVDQPEPAIGALERPSCL